MCRNICTLQNDKIHIRQPISMISTSQTWAIVYIFMIFCQDIKPISFSIHHCWWLVMWSALGSWRDGESLLWNTICCLLYSWNRNHLYEFIYLQIYNDIPWELFDFLDAVVSLLCYSIVIDKDMRIEFQKVTNLSQLIPLISILSSYYVSLVKNHLLTHNKCCLICKLFLIAFLLISTNTGLLGC